MGKPNLVGGFLDLVLLLGCLSEVGMGVEPVSTVPFANLAFFSSAHPSATRLARSLRRRGTAVVGLLGVGTCLAGVAAG